MKRHCEPTAASEKPAWSLPAVRLHRGEAGSDLDENVFSYAITMIILLYKQHNCRPSAAETYN